MTTGGAPVISKLPASIWREETLVRRFRVERELGSGGQAVVLVAYHRELDERVALKFLLPDVAQSAASIARFRREARAAAKIKNEHVVRIFDVCATATGIPFIVMEYLDGRDLEHVLQTARNGRLPVPDAVDIILQASEALAEGHRLGIVHRDLKPANLFCVDAEDGFPMIKVLDFGISKIQPLPGDVERTDRFEILGSPRYMSPEQIDASRDVDQRSDIWSLGVILYQALTGRVPFGGEIVADLWHKIRTDTPTALTELCRDIPAALDRVVMRCLEKEPARRFAHLGEFAEALAYMAPEHSHNSIARILRTTGTRPLVRQSSIPSITTDRTLVAGSLPPSNRPRWHRATLVGLGIGVTALVSFGAARLLTRDDGITEGPTTQSTATGPGHADHPAAPKASSDGSPAQEAPDASTATKQAPDAGTGTNLPDASPTISVTPSPTNTRKSADSQKGKVRPGASSAKAEGANTGSAPASSTASGSAPASTSAPSSRDTEPATTASVPGSEGRGTTSAPGTVDASMHTGSGPAPNATSIDDSSDSWIVRPVSRRKKHR